MYINEFYDPKINFLMIFNNFMIQLYVLNVTNSDYIIYISLHPVWFKININKL